MPFKRQLSVHIEVPPEAVFAYITDLPRHAEWADQRMEIAVAAGDVRPGTEFATTVDFMGKIHASCRVIEVRPPELLIYECEDRAGTHRWTMEVKPENGGSRLAQTIERVSVPLYIRLLQARVMWPLIGRGQIQRGLDNIKARLEGASHG